MVYQMWAIRPVDQNFDTANIYEMNPTLFSIELHHGGRFTRFPGIKYVEGKVRFIDLLDIDEFSVHEMDTIMTELGYVVPPVIYYHFRIPQSGLEFGLRALGNDEDVLNLAKYIAENKLIKVYTEHGSTNLVTYFMSPKSSGRVRIQEIADDAEPSENNQAQPSPPHTKIVDDQVLHVDNQAQASSELPFGSYMAMILGDNHYDFGSPELRVGRNRNPVSGGGPSCSKRLCLEYESNIDVEEQVRPNEAGNIPEAVEDMGEGEPSSDAASDENMGERRSVSDDDSDYLEDEDNYVEDVEVDMDDFNLNIEMDAEFIGGGAHEERIDKDDDIEDLDVINNDAWDSLEEGSDEDNRRRSILKQLGKEKKCNYGHIHKHTFCIGQKFKSKKDFKEKIELHALESRRDLALKKNDKLRLRAVCMGVVPAMNASNASGSNTDNKGKGKKVKSVKVKCTWVVHASRSNEESDWYVKTYNPKHTCSQSRKLKACTATFISKQIMSQVETNPEVPLRAIQEQFEEKYEIGVSMHKVFRAKAAATKVIVGDYTKQYEVLRDYILELQSTNADTTVKLDVYTEPIPDCAFRKFKRIYICLGPLKKGFKAGLRDLLGFDGAFMKGPFPGQVLTAVGLDSNNGIYPLAYAIVESENLNSWKWFLTCLGDDLDLCSNSNFTFVTDRQKGLVPAIAQLFPYAEHRYCLRHIYDNMRRKWRAPEYKEHLWKCATATTVQEFERYMKEFDFYDREACDWLKKIPPHHWSRSHFTGRAISDVFLNNMCEVFNSKLIKGRDKPIITCLEFIREYLMKRICNVMKVMNKCQGPLTPTATGLLKENETQASKYHARWNGASKYQVHGPWQDQHVVDTSNLSCTCRKWELTGLPCKHAIATFNEMSKNNEFHGDIYQWVHKVYYLDTWKEAYEFKVEPIKGRAMWPRSECPTKLTPPVHHNQVGRPKKKRTKSVDEKLSQSQKGGQSQGEEQVGKLTRKYTPVTCGKCKQKGHNVRTCKGLGGADGASQGGTDGASQAMN